MQTLVLSCLGSYKLSQCLCSSFTPEQCVFCMFAAQSDESKSKCSVVCLRVCGSKLAGSHFSSAAMLFSGQFSVCGFVSFFSLIPLYKPYAEKNYTISFLFHSLAGKQPGFSVVSFSNCPFPQTRNLAIIVFKFME